MGPRPVHVVAARVAVEVGGLACGDQLAVAQGSPTDPFRVQTLPIRYFKTIPEVARQVVTLCIWCRCRCATSRICCMSAASRSATRPYSIDETGSLRWLPSRSGAGVSRGAESAECVGSLYSDSQAFLTMKSHGLDRTGQTAMPEGRAEEWRTEIFQDESPSLPTASWSRLLADRIEDESFWPRSPDFAVVFVGREAAGGLESVVRPLSSVEMFGMRSFNRSVRHGARNQTPVVACPPKVAIGQATHGGFVPEDCQST